MDYRNRDRGTIVMDELANAVKERILELLEQQNLTVDELSKQAGLPSTTIEAIINLQEKDLSMEILYEITKAFNLTLPDFFNEEKFKNL